MLNIANVLPIRANTLVMLDNVVLFDNNINIGDRNMC